MPPLWRRFIFVLLLGGWMGGFSFYALVVIPTAGKVLGGEREVGFVTQAVTSWLNLIGIFTLGYFAWHLARDWWRLDRFFRRSLTGTWGLMAAMVPCLLLNHFAMSRHLAPNGFKIHEFSDFERLHFLYLWFATAQWGAALLHLLLYLRAWQILDAAPTAPIKPTP